MSWRTVVVTGNAKLDYKMDYLGPKAEATTRIFMSRRNWSVDYWSQQLLQRHRKSELIKHKIKVVFCDET